jgi:hypothetical protein
MFAFLPIEMERMIWKFYFSIDVLKEIYRQQSIWEEPSNQLFLLTMDLGCVQQNHTDLIRLTDEYIPHSNFLNWVMQDELDARPYIECEDCEWEERRCQYEEQEENLADRMTTFWDLSFYYDRMIA